MINKDTLIEMNNFHWIPVNIKLVCRDETFIIKPEPIQMVYKKTVAGNTIHHVFNKQKDIKAAIN